MSPDTDLSLDGELDEEALWDGVERRKDDRRAYTRVTGPGRRVTDIPSHADMEAALEREWDFSIKRSKGE